MRHSPLRLLPVINISARLILALFILSFVFTTGVQAQNKCLEQVTKSDKAQESRLALVIGNGDYKNHLLKNPVNDARAMAVLLKKQGFVVVEKENASRRDMEEAIRDFGRRLEATPGAAALFYFSGHSLQAEGQNWLVPVGHNIHSERDVAYEAVSANRVLVEMNGGRLNIVVLDACRDNSFLSSGKFLNRGLAMMDAPSGTLIAYAAGPGKTTDDNADAENGLYVQELLKQMQTPGLKIEDVFKQTRIQVKNLSKGRQLPWTVSSLENDFRFVSPVANPNKTDKTNNNDEVDTQAAVVITSDPPGASVIIDEQVVGVTPFKYTQELGVKKKLDVEVALKLEGYKTRVVKVSLLRGQAQTLQPIALVKSVPLKIKQPDDNNDTHDNGNLPKTRINPKDGAEMILIPAGPFQMGDDDQKDNPRHTVTLSAYYIYKNLITVKQFRAYDTANGSKYDWERNKPSWGWKDDHPMVRVTWAEADAYCKWVGGHLPTEAQWEKSARGTMGLKYPWGNSWDSSRLKHSTREVGDAKSTAPVGSFSTGASPYGVLDMEGNVFQWCADWYDKDFWSRQTVAGVIDPQNQNVRTNQGRVLRGGSWDGIYSRDFRTAFRIWFVPIRRNLSFGFRVAVGL